MRDRGLVGVGEDAGLVGEAEELGEVLERAGALLAADHDEMVLQAVEVGEEHDAGLVEAGRRLEDVARQRDGGLEQVEELVVAAAAERLEGGRGDRRDGVEDAEQGVGVAVLVAGDQLGVVEVVAGVHAHALRQAAAHGDLLLLRQERDLDAVDLGGVGLDRGEAGVHRRHVVGVAPVAGQRRVEHLAEPVDDHRLLHLARGCGRRRAR